MVSAAASRRITYRLASPSAGPDLPGVSTSDEIDLELVVPAHGAQIPCGFGRFRPDRASSLSIVLAGRTSGAWNSNGP
jgi:hypothetical protein